MTSPPSPPNRRRQWTTSHLHEIEFVEILSAERRPLSELPRVFRPLGFTVHYDVLTLDRAVKVPPWQSSSVVAVQVRCGEVEVFGFDGEWDAIRLKYLYATLPHELTDKFIDAVFAISRSLSLPIRNEGVEVNEADLRRRFDQCRDELLAETGENAGSEELAIMIRSTYPRRWP